MSEMKIHRAFIAIAFFVFPSSVFAFSDVDEGHVYAEAIEYLAEQGIIEGYGDGTYKPDQEINRAEFLKLMVASRNPGYEPPGTVYYDNCFPDVDWQEWYSYYVCSAKENGFVEGYPNGSFEPGSTINMAEALKITLGAYNYSFEDTDPWYQSILDLAESFDLFPESYAGPSQWVNRGEMAQIMYTMMSIGDYDFSLDYDEEPLEEAPQEEDPVTTVDASGEELDVLEEEFLGLLNDYRADLGLSSVDDDLNLNLAARNHSEWMYETGIYEHEGENGSYHTQRCIAAGTYCYGEILLHYYTEDAQEFLEAWQGSSAHNDIMTRWYYTDVGISFYGGYGTVVFSFTYDPEVDYGW